MSWFSTENDDQERAADGQQVDLVDQVDQVDQEFRDAWIRMEPWAYRSGRG